MADEYGYGGYGPQDLIDLRPSQSRPLTHQSDPRTLDNALSNTAQAGLYALPLGLSALGGPAGMSLGSMAPALIQSLLGPFDSPHPGVLYGGMPDESSTTNNLIRAYHGTTGNFERFDPGLSKDLGTHFGTRQQAENAIINPWSGEFPQGANVRPVDLDLGKSVRLPDVFSVLGKGMGAVARKLHLESPLQFNDEELSSLYSSAKRMDAIKRKAGGIRSWQQVSDSTLIPPAQKQEFADLERQFWKTVQDTIHRNGYDSATYSNKVEGKGDSYIVFDPNRVKHAFASGFEPTEPSSSGPPRPQQFYGPAQAKGLR